MKIVARFAVQLGGHIYHKGETCDFDGEVTERIAANFVDANGAALEVAAEKAKAKAKGKDQGAENDETARASAATDAGAAREEELVKLTVKTMGRDGIVQALDAMGVAYSHKANTEKLARALLVARGDLEG